MSDIFYGEGTEIGLRRNNLAIEWTNIGEGLCGDYDPEDDKDVNLLRFDVYVVVPNDLESQLLGDLERKEPIEDASYCTNVPASTDEETLKRLLVRLMDELPYQNEYDGEYNHPNIKKLCEHLSWVAPDWVAAPLIDFK